MGMKKWVSTHFRFGFGLFRMVLLTSGPLGGVAVAVAVDVESGRCLLDAPEGGSSSLAARCLVPGRKVLQVHLVVVILVVIVVVGLLVIFGSFPFLLFFLFFR